MLELALHMQNHLRKIQKRNSSRFGQIDQLWGEIQISQHKLFVLGEGQGLSGDSCLTNLEVFTQGENKNANMGKPGFVMYLFLI